MKIWDLQLRFILFSIKFYKNICFIESCYRILLFLFFNFTFIYGPLDKQILFYRKQFSPSFTKKEKLKFSALYLSKCFCLASHRRSVMDVLTTVLIKQRFYVAHWLVIKMFLKGVIGWKDLTNINRRKCQSSNTCEVMLVLTFSFHRVIMIFTL